MKKLMIASTLLIATTLAQATPAQEQLSVTVTEMPMTSEKSMNGFQVGGARSGLNDFPSNNGFYPSYQQPQDGDKLGKVISTSREIVALGEAVYTLVQKGKPSNTTEYAPISIVPRDPTSKEYIDPFELENCSMPVTKKFKASIKSGPTEVVRFEYMIIYSIGCQFNGAGKYISSAMVQPVSVKTNFGWDFTATMKLSGIMNHGTKAEPVAGAMLTMKYQMNSWRTSFERNDTIHITGNGDLKSY